MRVARLRAQEDVPGAAEGQARRAPGLTEGPAFAPGEAGGPLSRGVRRRLESSEGVWKAVEFGREREGKDDAKFLA